MVLAGQVGTSDLELGMIPPVPNGQHLSVTIHVGALMPVADAAVSVAMMMFTTLENFSRSSKTNYVLTQLSSM